MNTNKIRYTATKLAHRSYFAFMNVGSKLLPWPEPEIIEGVGCSVKIPELVPKCGMKKPLVVTSHTARTVAAEPVMRYLDEAGITYAVFDGVKTNPTDVTVKAIKEQYLRDNCDGFIAIGGGSPIDAVKAAGALIVHPRMPLRMMCGYFKVLAKVPPIIAVPTTSGSGSEASMVAVITAEATRFKFTITDPFLMPKFAVVDPQFTVSVPPMLTATTGMDVLTHAVESYLTWTFNTNETNRHAEAAAVKTFGYLARAVEDGTDIEAREMMSIAATEAGRAFTRTGLGYVHAIAHKLGGLYNTPHGLANAVILPIVLEDYGAAVHPQLAHLAEICGVKSTGTEAEKSAAFIAAIREMNKKFGIPTGFDFIKPEDVDVIVKWAVQEGNTTFPVPVVYDTLRCRHVVNRIIAEA